MKHSRFSQKFAAGSGILQLMDDLGRYAGRPGMVMLGGGNPSHIPAVQDYFRQCMLRILDSENEFESLIGNYPGPGGPTAFVEALADYLCREVGWPITPANITLTNGSQTAFFYLFNMFAGAFPDGSRKRILLPLAPEYIGYEEAGLEPDLFVSYRPEIQFLENRLFKYHVDFSRLVVDDTIGAICVSRPTNPTGNVLTQAEMDQLSELARQHDIPFIVDNAYGLPFPNIIFTDEPPPAWDPHIIMCLSLSKLGLPGARTGIIISNETITRRLRAMNAVISLAPGGFGGALALEAVKSGEIGRLSSQAIRPHYEKKAWQAVAWLQEALDGVDFFIHKPEGAIFLWLWLRDLPLTSQALYEALKERGVLVIPGQHFYPGLAGDWRHKTECVRINYAQDDETVRAGLQIIGEVVREAYRHGERR